MELIRNLEVQNDDDFLKDIPKWPTYFSPEQKKHYKQMGSILIKAKKVKETYIKALEIYAVAAAQMEWAIKAINEKNATKPGSGYIQVYASKATNITTEMVIRNDAISTLEKCFKQFGMDPRSDKDLKQVSDPGQLNIFEAFAMRKNG